MIQLRLFRASAPFEQIDERTLNSEELVIGRDGDAGWTIADEACEISRRHIVLRAAPEGVLARDMSANGVFVGDARRRLERDAPTLLAGHESLYLGRFMIVMEPLELAPANDHAAFNQALFAPIKPEAMFVRSDWEDAPAPANGVSAPATPRTDAAMLDAFCAGAGLDASSFIGEDPVIVMQRAGAIYKQMVLGLSDLLSERQALKADFEMDRTTVGPVGNNPFKWAPTRRVAIDLLRQRSDGFLSGPAALKASFEDLRKHAACLVAGARHSITAVLGHLEPDAVEAELKSGAGLRLNKAEACWRLYQARHGALAGAREQNPAELVAQAFRSGYEAQLRTLEAAGTRS
jgi:predicted component of type VI protein secretion system